METNIYKLNTSNWQHKLNSVGDVVVDADDISQCYELIFKTQKNSVVLNPNLGWNLIDYLGKPLNLVENEMKKELKQALIIQEPRAIVNKITLSYENTSDFAQGHLTLTVNFTVKLTNKTYEGTYKL